MNHFYNVFTAIVLSAVIVGCSDSSKKSSTTLIDLKPSGGSCDFQINDGDMANMDLVGTDNERNASFSKPYNDNYLTAVLSTSLEETMRFINETGVRVYKTPSDNSGCNMFSNAADPSSGLLDKWNEVAKDDGPQTGYLLGLYLPKKSVNDDSNDDKAAILVRENTNRWTVVHEFMHHLFMLKQEEKGNTDQSIRLNMANDLDTYKNLKDSLQSDVKTNKLSSSDRQKLEKSFQRFVVSFDMFVRSFMLEEMTIEKKLHDLYGAGKLKFVPTYAYDSGIRYIHGNAKKAEELLNVIQDEINELKTSKYNMSVAESSQLVSERRNEMTLILQQYPNKGLKDDLESDQLMGYSAKGKIVKKRVYRPHSCSREKVAEKLIEKIKLTLQKTSNKSASVKK